MLYNLRCFFLRLLGDDDYQLVTRADLDVLDDKIETLLKDQNIKLEKQLPYRVKRKKKAGF